MCPKLTPSMSYGPLHTKAKKVRCVHIKLVYEFKIVWLYPAPPCERRNGYLVCAIQCHVRSRTSIINQRRDCIKGSCKTAHYICVLLGLKASVYILFFL